MIRSFRLAALAAFAALAFVAAPSADAAFSYSTSITGVSGNANLLNGGTPGATVQVAGLTLAFAPDANSNVTASGAIVSTFVTVSGVYTGPANGTTFTVSETIRLNGVAAFVQTITYTALPFGISSGGATISPGLNTPVTIAGTTFTATAANATGIDPNSGGSISTTILASNAVPEPASLAMLGLGLVGTAGFAARRRLARA